MRITSCFPAPPPPLTSAFSQSPSLTPARESVRPQVNLLPSPVQGRANWPAPAGPNHLAPHPLRSHLPPRQELYTHQLTRKPPSLLPLSPSRFAPLYCHPPPSPNHAAPSLVDTSHATPRHVANPHLRNGRRNTPGSQSPRLSYPSFRRPHPSRSAGRPRPRNPYPLECGPPPPLAEVTLAPLIVTDSVRREMDCSLDQHDPVVSPHRLPD